MEGQGIVFRNKELRLVMDDGTKIIPFRLCVNQGEVTVRTSIDKGGDSEEVALQFLATLASDLQAAGMNTETLTRKTSTGQRIDSVTIKRG